MTLFRRLIFAAASLTLSFCPVRASVVLYQETFRHPELVPTVNYNPRVPASIGWTSYYGATASNITTRTGSDRVSALIAWTDGSPSADGPGYLYSREEHTSSVQQRTIAMLSPEFTDTWDPGAGAIQVSFLGNQSHAGIQVQFLAKIGEQWYVRNEDFALPVGTQTSFRDPSVNHVQSITRSFTLDLAGNLWSQFTLTPDASMAVGSVASGPLVGEISQVGFLVTNPTASTSGTVYIARVDSLLITQVPEPSRMVLLMLGGLGWLCLSRRRS